MPTCIDDFNRVLDVKMSAYHHVLDVGKWVHPTVLDVK
jgi:hypothetical protein